MSEGVQGSAASLVTAVPRQAPRAQSLGARGPVAGSQNLGAPALTPELAPSPHSEAGTQQAGTQQTGTQEAGTRRGSQEAGSEDAGARRDAAEPTPMTARQQAVRRYSAAGSARVQAFGAGLVPGHGAGRAGGSLNRGAPQHPGPAVSQQAGPLGQAQRGFGGLAAAARTAGRA